MRKRTAAWMAARTAPQMRCRANALAISIFCATNFFPQFFPLEKLESAKVTRGQRRVYDLRHFRAGPKAAQNWRGVCSWVVRSIELHQRKKAHISFFLCLQAAKDIWML